MVCIKMAVTVKVYKPYAEVLQWLQDNVGPMLHYKPIIFWHGEGWHLKTSYEVAPRGQLGKHFCVVDFDDEKKAIWFKLIWG
jgi:hypothetical protein